MKRLWKRYKLLILTLLVLTLFVGSTYAYLVAYDTQIINTFKFAKIDTNITEEVGATKKKATIQNTGESPVYVRAQVLVSAADVGVPAENVNFKPVSQAPDPETTQAPSGNVIYIYCNQTESQWKWESDGWCYYNGVLQPGASTAPLIYAVYVGTGVQVPDGATFEVDIYEESILTSDTGGSAASAKDAFTPKTTP